MMDLDLTSFHKAIYSLDTALKVYQSYLSGYEKHPDFIQTLKAGVVQNFEFTYELSWKFIKRWLEVNISPTTADGVTRRELFRLAAENLLIIDVSKWMEFNKARNITSHTYDEEKADEVLKTALEFINYVKDLYSAMEERNQ